MIYGAFLQAPLLVQFSGGITYNSNGFAVLPSYTIITIPASIQPIKSSSLKWRPEGTHYASYLEFVTDYPVFVDNNPNRLGDYIIYGFNNYVYKVYSSQNYLPFPMLPVNHVEGHIVRDNRLVYSNGTLNLPFPEIDSTYAPLFELIAMVNSCFTSPTINTLWGFQQEFQPAFPYCVVTLEAVENIDNTNFTALGEVSSVVTYYTNISRQLVVSFGFYSYDQVQTTTLMEQFKLNYVNYTFSTNLLQWVGFVEGENVVEKVLYEDRTIFVGVVKMRFTWIVQQATTNTSAYSTIETVAFNLSIPPVTT